VREGGVLVARIRVTLRNPPTVEKGGLPIPPAKKVAVVACMDVRMSPYPILGLEPGDPQVIRNGVLDGLAARGPRGARCRPRRSIPGVNVSKTVRMRRCPATAASCSVST
jgi:hypothetical protein